MRNNAEHSSDHCVPAPQTAPCKKHARNSRARRCTFRFADGRRCTLPPAANPRGLCRSHAERQRGSVRTEDVSHELASLSGHFRTSTDIHHLLGKLWRLVTQGRIPRRDAVTLAYIAQLLLQSLPHVRSEIRESGGGWNLNPMTPKTLAKDESRESPSL